MSQALTVGREISVERIKLLEDEIGGLFYAVGGTPADSVKIYLDELAVAMPDIVVSGINNGANLGTDVIYSGTVGAATEGYFKGIPSFALSRECNSYHEYDEVADRYVSFIESKMAMCPDPFLLNLNFPRILNKDFDFVYTRLGIRDYINAYLKKINADGSVSYLVKGEVKETALEPGTDIFAIDKGMITVTPLSLERTDFKHFKLQ